MRIVETQEGKVYVVDLPKGQTIQVYYCTQLECPRIRISGNGKEIFRTSGTLWASLTKKEWEEFMSAVIALDQEMNKKR